LEAGQETAVGVADADVVENTVELDAEDTVELDVEEKLVEEVAVLDAAELEEVDEVEVCSLSLAPQTFADFTAAPTELLR